MLAQALGEYGMLEAAARGMRRLTNSLDVWMSDWGTTAVVIGGVVLTGWVLLKLLVR